MRKTKYTKKLLEPIVKKSFSYANVIKHLGLKQTGGNQSNIKDHIVYLNIDTSHFKGQGWSKGFTKKTNDSVRKRIEKISANPKNVFKKNSGFDRATVRKLFLLESVYECKCGNGGSWRGKELSLQLDHINGDRRDHRKENLRWLCPNCHSQTETWGNCKNAFVA